MSAFYRLFLTSSLLLGLLSGLSTVWAQAPAFQDATMIAPASGTAAGTSIVADAAGNSYATGYFTGLALFGTTSIRSLSSYPDIYVTKQDVAGNYLWAIRVGGTDIEHTPRIALDGSGNVLLAGYFQSPTISFGSTTLVASAPIYSGSFVAKLSASGNWLWAAKAEGGVSGLAVDGNGDAIITGGYYDRQIVIGSTTLQNVNQGSQRTADIFVAKVSSSGTWLWAIRGGGTGDDGSVSVSASANGTIYITGMLTSGRGTFGGLNLPGFGNYILAGNYTLFVAKVGAAGSWNWVVLAGSGSAPTDATSKDLVVDGSGDVYLTGSVRSAAVQFGPTTLAANTTGSDSDVFVAKLNAAGIWQWAVRADGNSYPANPYSPSTGLSITLAGVGAVCLSGQLTSSSTSFGSITLTKNNSLLEGFIARISLTGTWLWAGWAGGKVLYSDNIALKSSDVAVNSNGDALLTGGFSGATASFGPLIVTNSGSSAAFVAKLTASGNFLWAKPIVGNSTISISRVIADAAGNRYMMGVFTGDIWFGSTQPTALGHEDVFIAKQNAAGTYLWAVQAGSTGVDYASSLTLDASGNAYFGAVYDTSNSFMPVAVHFGAITRTTYGASDVLIAKISSGGAWQWVAQGGGNGIDATSAITTDAAGGVYIAGHFASPATFGSTILPNTNTGTDIVVAKLDAAGNWLWAVRAGGASTDYCGDMQLQGNSLYVVGGSYSSAVVFGSITLANQAGPGSWVAKLDVSGNWLWAVGGGTAQSEYTVSSKLTIDGTGGVYIAGLFASAQATFGSTVLANNNPSACGAGSCYSADLFVAKLDATGTWQWAVRGGSTGDDASDALLTDPSGNVYLAGHFASNIATFGSTTLTNASATQPADVVVAKLDAGGGWQWAVSAGDTGYESCSSLLLGNNGEAYLWGMYDSPSVNFGSTTLFGSPGGATAFVARLANVTTPLASMGVRPSYRVSIWPNPSSGTVSVSGIAPGQVVQILDATGHLILTQATSPGTGTLSLKLPPGLYLVRTQTGIQRLLIH